MKYNTIKIDPDCQDVYLSMTGRNCGAGKKMVCGNKDNVYNKTYQACMYAEGPVGKVETKPSVKQDK